MAIVNYTPKIGELVFTNCGSGEIKRENENFVPWYHITATFCNDNGNVYTVGFSSLARTDDVCDCIDSRDRTLEAFYDMMAPIWLERIAKIEEEIDRKGLEFRKMDSASKSAYLAYIGKARRVITKLHKEAWAQPYTNCMGLTCYIEEGHLRSRDFSYDYRTILNLVNKTFGCSYTSIKTIPSLEYDTVCRCK